MKIILEIPKEFEEHFKTDRFEDSLHRLSADAHLIAGNYEQETAKMLRDAFKNGVVLQKGHGRLIDENEIKRMIEEAKVRNESSKTFAENIIRVAPAIIEADSTRDCKTCGHSNDGKCAGTEECHECMWVNNYIENDIEFDVHIGALEDFIKRKPEYIFERSTCPHDEGGASIFTLDREHSLSVNMIAEIMYEGKGDITFFKSLLDELQSKNIIKRRGEEKMDNEELTTAEELSMELTVQDVNELINEINSIRHALDVNNLTDKEREDCRYFLALYIHELRNKKVRI